MSRLLAILASTLVLAFSVFVFPLVIVFLLEQRQVPASLISLVATVGGLAVLITTFVMPGLLSRLKPWQGMAIGALITACTLGLTALLPTLLVILLCRFVYGLGFTLSWGAGESWINARWPHDKLGRALGAYMVTWYATMPLAPLVLAQFAGRELQLLWILAALLLVSILFLWPLRQEAALPADKHVVHWKSWKLEPLAMFTSFISGGLESIRFLLVPLCLTQMGWSKPEVLTGILWLSLGGVAFNVVSGWLADHLRPARALLVIAAFGMSVTPFAIGQNYSVMALAVLAVLGGCLNTVYPLASGMIGKNVPVASRLEANSAVMLYYTIGILLLPPLFGLALDRLGPGSFMGMIAAAFLLLIGAVLALQGRRSGSFALTGTVNSGTPEA